MTILEREFYRSARGPTPADMDAWCLILDRDSGQLLVRHEWQATRNAGREDLTVDEFLGQDGAAQEALIALLFERVGADG